LLQGTILFLNIENIYYTTMTYSSCCGNGTRGSYASPASNSAAGNYSAESGLDRARSSYALREQRPANDQKAYSLGPGNSSGYDSGLGNTRSVYRTPECGKYKGLTSLI
jgi:hypothetical protein